MVAVNAGVVKSGLVISEVPPVGTSNQSICPKGASACKFTVEPAHIGGGVLTVGAGGTAVTLTVTVLRGVKVPLSFAET